MYSESNSINEDDDIFMKYFKLFRQFNALTYNLNSNDLKLILLESLSSLDSDSLMQQFKLKVLFSPEKLILEKLQKIFFLAQNKQLDFSQSESMHWRNYGFKSSEQIKCYEPNHLPGLFILPNPFKNGYQRYFIKKCLRDYPNLPNRTNLDAHMNRNGLNLWLNAIKYFIFFSNFFNFTIFLNFKPKQKRLNRFQQAQMDNNWLSL